MSSIKEILCADSDIDKKEIEIFCRKIFLILCKNDKYRKILASLAYKEEMILDSKDFEIFAISNIAECILSKKNYICSKDKVSNALIIKLVVNWFIDRLRRGKISEYQFLREADLSSKDISVSTMIDSFKFEREKFRNSSFTASLDLEKLTSLVKKSLSEREKKILCNRISKELKFNDKYISFPSKSAEDKAFSRLRQKLKRLFYEHIDTSEFSVEESEIFIKNVLIKICNKLRGDNET